MLAVPSKAVFGYIGNITNMATLSCSWIMIVSYIYIYIIPYSTFICISIIYYVVISSQ